MAKITKHIMIPANVTVIFFVIAALPVDVFGCRNLGLIAAFIAVGAGLLGIIAASRAIICKVRGDDMSSLWMVSALILAVPAIFIVVSTNPTMKNLWH
jgi:ABC-type branched-subunit amino acid transport system permease subunit